jgi:hypothetical protein
MFRFFELVIYPSDLSGRSIWAIHLTDLSEVLLLRHPPDREIDQQVDQQVDQAIT